MKKHHGLLALLVFATLPCAAQTLRLYDDFNNKFLDPARWSWASCSSGNGLELECVREIRDEKLHLAHRGFGLTDSNSGMQNGGASVLFANSATIKTIKTDLLVRSIVESPCAANPSFGGGAGIWGTFFNTGTGNSNDDAGASLGLSRFANDPPGELNVHGQTYTSAGYSTYFSLGTVTIGTPITITLSWDQPNHQFLISYANNLTHVTTEGTMPYAASDTTPAARPGKLLLVSGAPANCTANSTFVYSDALFDNVYTGQ